MRFPYKRNIFVHWNLSLKLNFLRKGIAWNGNAIDVNGEVDGDGDSNSEPKKRTLRIINAEEKKGYRKIE